MTCCKLTSPQWFRSICSLQILFMFKRTHYYSPSLWLLGVSVVRQTSDDVKREAMDAANVANVAGRAGKLFGYLSRARELLLTALRTALISSALIFKVSKCWQCTFCQRFVHVLACRYCCWTTPTGCVFSPVYMTCIYIMLVCVVCIAEIGEVQVLTEVDNQTCQQIYGFLHVLMWSCAYASIRLWNGISLLRIRANVTSWGWRSLKSCLRRPYHPSHVRGAKAWRTMLGKRDSQMIPILFKYSSDRLSLWRYNQRSDVVGATKMYANNFRCSNIILPRPTVATVCAPCAVTRGRTLRCRRVALCFVTRASIGLWGSMGTVLWQVFLAPSCRSEGSLVFDEWIDRSYRARSAIRTDETRFAEIYNAKCEDFTATGVYIHTNVFQFLLFVVLFCFVLSLCFILSELLMLLFCWSFGSR
jgi:hypothetical protein